VEDPSFIGPFYSRCKIGELNGNEVEEYAKKRPGVYFRYNVCTVQYSLTGARCGGGGAVLANNRLILA
jgi:hypothetical protein